jgi:hypothetical protein
MSFVGPATTSDRENVASITRLTARRGLPSLARGGEHSAMRGAAALRVAGARTLRFGRMFAGCARRHDLLDTAGIAA